MDVKRIIAFAAMGILIVVAFFAGTQSDELVENTPFSHLGPSYSGKVVKVSATELSIDADGKPITFEINSKTEITQRFSQAALVAGTEVQVHYQDTSGRKVAKLVRVLNKEASAGSSASPGEASAAPESGSPAASSASGAPASEAPASGAPASASPAAEASTSASPAAH